MREIVFRDGTSGGRRPCAAVIAGRLCGGLARPGDEVCWTCAQRLGRRDLTERMPELAPAEPELTPGPAAIIAEELASADLAREIASAVQEYGAEEERRERRRLRREAGREATRQRVAGIVAGGRLEEGRQALRRWTWGVVLAWVVWAGAAWWLSALAAELRAEGEALAAELSARR